MAKGNIKRLITERGFGFIQTEGEEDIFFHRNELVGVQIKIGGSGWIRTADQGLMSPLLFL